MEGSTNPLCDESCLGPHGVYNSVAYAHRNPHNEAVAPSSYPYADKVGI